MSAHNYESVLITEPEISTDQVDQLLAKIKQLITDNKGTFTAEDRWGRRRLAYPLRGFREGFYTVLNFTAEPTAILALEHLYNVTGGIIRQQTIRHYPSNKKFAPRRERPAGSEGFRGSRSSSGSSRPRSDSAPRPAPSVTPATEAAAPSAESAPQGDKP